jgi:hypothetical protein
MVPSWSVNQGRKLIAKELEVKMVCSSHVAEAMPLLILIRWI